MATDTPDTSTPNTAKRNVVVTRVFDAPPDRVWSAWTDAERVMQWWGPAGFTSPVARMDVREGGTSLVCMQAPDGTRLYNTWTYRKIVPLQRLEFVQHFADENGKTVNPADVGLPPEIPREVPHVVTFKPVGDDQTEMTVTEFGYPSDQIVELSKAGLEQCLDKMAAGFAQA